VAGVYALETSVVSVADAAYATVPANALRAAVNGPAVVDVIATATASAQGAELTSTWHGRHTS